MRLQNSLMDQGVDKRFDTQIPAHRPGSNAVGKLAETGLSSLRRWLRDESVRRVYSVAGRLFRGRLLAGVVSLAYLAVTAKTLGASQFGVLVLINLVAVTIGDLAIFPGWYAVIRFGTPGLENASTPGFRKLLSFTSCLELGSGLVAVLIAVLVAPRVAPLLGIPTQSIPLMLVFSLSALLSARSTPSAILYLGERFNTLSIQQALAGLVRLTGAVLASWSDAGLAGFVYAWLVANLAEAGLMWLFAIMELRRRGLLKGMFVSPSGIADIYPDIWHFTVNTKLNKSLEDVSPRITPIAVGMVLEPMAVGLYHVAFRLGMLLSQPIIVLVGTVYPELTRLVRAGDLAGVRRVVLRSGLLTSAVGLPVFLIYLLFGDTLLNWIGGVGFGKAQAVLVLVACSQFISLLGFPLGSALQATGRPAVVLRVNLAAMSLLLPVLVILLQRLGLIGAGLYAIGLSTLIVGILGLLWRKQMQLPVYGPLLPLP